MKNNKIKLLIIEDEDFDVKRIQNTLEPFSNQIKIQEIISSGREALRLIQKNPTEYDVIILDYQISGGLYGVDLISSIKKLAPSIQIIVITKMTLNQTDVNFAVNLIESGASWFGTKNPVDIEDFIYQPTDFLLAIQNAYEKRLLQLEKSKLIYECNASLSKLEKTIENNLSQQKLVGDSAEIKQIRYLIMRYANVDVSLLITGESGTGKELVATHVHYYSKRRFENFITVNCSAIPDTLFESELFGHVKGAFTDAKQEKAGLFEQANKGTIFLDEVSELSLMAQAKLLRVLETGEIDKIGRKKQYKVDVRVIAATNKDLPKLVSEKKFREDLYYRLNILNIHIPSLRKRPDDIKVLLDYFLKKYCQEHSIPEPVFDNSASEFLHNFNWYGNIRQLKNLALRMLLLHNGQIDMNVVRLCLEDQIQNELNDYGTILHNKDFITPLKEAETNFRKKYISAARSFFDTDAETAKHLGLAKSNFHRLLKDLKLK